MRLLIIGLLSVVPLVCGRSTPLEPRTATSTSGSSGGTEASSSSGGTTQRPSSGTTSASSSGAPVICTSEGGFAPQADYAVGHPDDMEDNVVVADVTGDGHVDISIPDSTANYLNVLPGNGDGSFGSPFTIPTGQSPRDLIVADLNGDGIADLAVTQSGVSSVGVFIGKGNGQFATSVSYLAGSSPEWIGAGDLNADGALDLVVSDLVGASIFVYLGKGDGTFAAAAGYPAGGGGYRGTLVNLAGPNVDVALADVNGNTLSVLFGKGDGTFGSPLVVIAGDGPTSVVSADFNLDGVPDLLVGNVFGDGSPDHPNGSLTFLLGSGGGAFGLSQTISVPNAGSPTQVVTADFNLDGQPDIAEVNGNAQTLAVMLGDGRGGFGRISPYQVGLENNDALTAADVNGDGAPDLVAVDHEGVVSVLLNLYCPMAPIHFSAH